MNVTQSNELLELIPETFRKNIKWVATDSSGHRTAFYTKPKLNATGYWETVQPYYHIDRVDPIGWQESLIQIERDLSLQQFVYIAAPYFIALAGMLFYVMGR